MNVKWIVSLSLISIIIIFFKMYHAPIDINFKKGDFILRGFSTLKTINSKEPSESHYTYPFKGFVYGMQTNKKRNSVIISYNLPAKGYFFLSYSGFKEIFSDGRVKTYKFKDSTFLAGSSFYTFQNFIVIEGDKEVGVFDLNDEKFVLRIPLEENQIHVNGNNEIAYVSAYDMETQMGNVKEINLSTLELQQLNKQNFIPPDILAFQNDELYGLYLHKTDYIYDDKKIRNKLVKWNSLNEKFEEKATLPYNTHDFTVYQNKAFIISEKQYLMVLDLTTGHLENIKLEPDIWLKDIKVLNNHIYILALKVESNGITDKNIIYVVDPRTNEFDQLVNWAVTEDGAQEFVSFD